eukprot:gene20699-biopygen22135
MVVPHGRSFLGRNVSGRGQGVGRAIESKAGLSEATVAATLVVVGVANVSVVAATFAPASHHLWLTQLPPPPAAAMGLADLPDKDSWQGKASPARAAQLGKQGKASPSQESLVWQARPANGAQARHGRAGQACVEQRVSAGVFWQDKAIFAGHAGQASPGTIGGCGMPVQAPHGGSTAETSPRPPQPLPGTPACGESPQAGLWHGDDSVAVTRATAVHVLLTGLHCSRTFSRCRIDVLFPHPRFPPSQVPTMCTAPGRDDAEHIPARLRFEFKGAGASSTLGGTAGNAGRPRAR